MKDQPDLEIRRLVSWLLRLHKIFTNDLETDFENVHSQQPRKQPGFRKGLSTKKHILTVDLELERTEVLRKRFINICWLW